MSQSLEFSIRHNNRDFHVEYESESRQRNILMSIVTDGLPIDTTELRQYKPELYRQIKAAMKNNADTFWSDEEEREREINAVPTIAYQSKVHHAFDYVIESFLKPKS